MPIDQGIEHVVGHAKSEKLGGDHGARPKRGLTVASLVIAGPIADLGAEGDFGQDRPAQIDGHGTPQIEEARQVLVDGFDGAHAQTLEGEAGRVGQVQIGRKQSRLPAARRPVDVERIGGGL